VKASLAQANRLFAADPERADIFASLELEHTQRGQWEALVELYNHRLAATSLKRNPSETTRLQLRLGQILEERLLRTEQAARCYEALLCQEPTSPIALHQLRRLYVHRGDWSKVTCIANAEFKSLREAWERATFHVEMGTLWAEQFRDWARAQAAFEAALSIDSKHADALVGLARLHEARGEWEDAVDDWARLAEIQMGPDRANALIEQARVLAEALSERAAAERCLTHALAEDSSCRRAAIRLEQLWLQQLEHTAHASDTNVETVHLHERCLDTILKLATLRAESLGDPASALAVLEAAVHEFGALPCLIHPLAAHCREVGDHARLIALCRRAAAEAREPAERAEWWKQLGEVLCAQGRQQEAKTAWARAVADHPDDADCAEKLKRLCRELGDTEALAHLLEIQLARCTSPPAELPLRIELAEIEAGELRHPEAALLHYRRALEIEPRQPEVLERALALARELAKPELALALLERLGEHVDAATLRADLAVQRAELLAKTFGRADAAIAAYREALAYNPAHEQARRALREILQSLGRFPELLATLESEAENTHGSEREVWLERGARLAWSQVSLAAALPWLEKLRALRPHDLRVLARIADIHRRSSHSTALLDVLEEQCRLCTEPKQRLALLRERALLLETSLARPEQAVEILEQIRRETPACRETLENLARLYALLKQPHALAGVLSELIPNSSPESRNAQRQQLARLFLDELDDPERAAVELEAAIAEAPAKGPQRAALLSDLGRARLARQQHRAFAHCAEAELEALPREESVYAERRRELHRCLTRVYREELAQPERALEHLRHLVDAETTSDAHRESAHEQRGYADSLFALLRSHGCYVELARRLAERTAQIPCDAACWLELAEVREGQLHELRPAQQAYREALRQHPGNLVALRGLRRTSERLNDWEEVARTLEEEIESTARDDAMRAALLRRLGDVYWKKLGCTTQAQRAYTTARALTPRDLRLLRTQEELLEAVENWRGLRDLYRLEIEEIDGGEAERCRRLWLRVAELSSDRLEDPMGALAALEAAHAIAPISEEAASRRRIAFAHRSGDLHRLTAALRDHCTRPGALPSEQDVYELARTLHDLGETREARERLEAALSTTTTHVPTWDLAAELRIAQGDRIGAADALIAGAALCAERDACERLLRAAQWLVECDPPRAADCAAQVAARAPTHPQAHALLARYYAQLGRSEDAARAARRALAQTDAAEIFSAERLAELREIVAPPRAKCTPKNLPAESALRPAWNREEAWLHAQTLEQKGEHAKAAECFGVIAARDPAYSAAALAQARLLRCLGCWQLAAEKLRAFSSAYPGPPNELGPVQLELARLLAGPLQEPRAARDVLHQILEHVPDFTAARDDLAEVLVQIPETHGEAVALHRTLLAQAPTRCTSLRALASIAASRGDDGNARDGFTILRALGMASPAEQRAGTTRLHFQSDPRPALEDPVWECLRKLACAASTPLAHALGASQQALRAARGDPAIGFEHAALIAEAELCAPALVPLPTDEVAAVLTLLVQLAEAAESVAGDGYLLNALAAALDKRTRRHLRRLLQPVGTHRIAAIDFEAWRAELRAMACAIALERCGGDLELALRSVLRNAADFPEDVPPPGAPIVQQVATCPTAHALLRQVVLRWIDSFNPDYS